MRLLKIECKKIITHPFLWIVWVTFVLFQLFQIYGYVGNSFMQQNLQNMYTAVLDAGVAPEEAARNAGKEVTAAEKESHEYNEKSEMDRQGTYGESEYREAYEDYRSTYGGMYDNLDMMKILEKKQEMYNYHPKGNMQQFLEDNYRKLQFRVEAIRSTEENSYGFYPGNQYKIHSILYGHIWKSLILEGAVLMMLSVLFLMDYERINKTRDIVIATVAGKECIYNILIMEEKQTIIACGAGASSKIVFHNESDENHAVRIERIENVKDVRSYVERIDEMIERKRKFFEDNCFL